MFRHTYNEIVYLREREKSMLSLYSLENTRYLIVHLWLKDKNCTIYYFIITIAIQRPIEISENWKKKFTYASHDSDSVETKVPLFLLTSFWNHINHFPKFGQFELCIKP